VGMVARAATAALPNSATGSGGGATSGAGQLLWQWSGDCGGGGGGGGDGVAGGTVADGNGNPGLPRLVWRRRGGRRSHARCRRLRWRARRGGGATLSGVTSGADGPGGRGEICLLQW
jgi:hypothetical protein